MYDFDNEAFDGQKCCEQCQLWHSTTNIVSSSIRQCRCGVDDGTATKESGSGWEGGSCIQDGSGKKKRSISNSLERLKRQTVSLVKERIIDCVQTDNTGYWKYDYLIPEKCYSKFLIKAICQYLIIYFLVINCTQSDLEAIATNNDLVQIVGDINDVHYTTEYEYIHYVYLFIYVCMTYFLALNAKHLVNSLEDLMEDSREESQLSAKLIKLGVQLICPVNVSYLMELIKIDMFV